MCILILCIIIHVYTCPAVGRLTTSAELEAEVEGDVLRSRFTTDVATFCSVVLLVVKVSDPS